MLCINREYKLFVKSDIIATSEKILPHRSLLSKCIKDNTKMDLMSCEWLQKTAYIVWAKGQLSLDKILEGFTNTFSISMLWFLNLKTISSAALQTVDTILSKNNQTKLWIYFFVSQLNPESAPNNSNETYTFMCLGRAGRFGQQ